MGEDSGRGAATTGRRRHDDEHATTTTPISATEMLPPNRADAGTRRGGDDDSLAAAAAQAHSRCSPHAHSRCSAQAVTEASGAATAPASLLPQAFRSLQPPSFTGLTAPLTQEDGWWRRGRRRDDDDATTSMVGTGRKGRRVTLISKAHSSVPNLGMGSRRRRGALLSGLAGRRGGDAARRGAVGRHRRPGRCGSYCSATSGSCPRAGRLRRGAGAPHARVAAAPDLAGGFLHELTEN